MSTSTAVRRRSLSRADRVSLGGMTATIAVLHLIGWGTLLLVVVPRGQALGDGHVFGVGLGVTAYVLGMRHAFDADHIAAIDNTTRTLMTRDRRPLSVGFWFSLGHSSVVFGLCLLLALGARALVGQVRDEGSTLQQVTGLIGTSVSAGFLLLIGLLNLIVLRQIVAVLRRVRRGEVDQDALDTQLTGRGLLNRVLGRVTAQVAKPWHMYPVGLLFGLGFDTATEVSLLALAGGAAVSQLPWYAMLTLPVLFAAGMSLLDTADGCLMNVAYGWALAQPVRKVYYNLTVTALSVAVALGIGGVEAAAILAERVGSAGGLLSALGSVDVGLVGYAVVALSLLAWLAPLVAVRVRRQARATAGQNPAGATVR